MVSPRFLRARRLRINPPGRPGIGVSSRPKGPTSTPLPRGAAAMDYLDIQFSRRRIDAATNDPLRGEGCTRSAPPGDGHLAAAGGWWGGGGLGGGGCGVLVWVGVVGLVFVLLCWFGPFQDQRVVDSSQRRPTRPVSRMLADGSAPMLRITRLRPIGRASTRLHDLPPTTPSNARSTSGCWPGAHRADVGYSFFHSQCGW